MNKDNDSETIRILVVDDDKPTRDVLKAFLKDEPYSITEASNGVEALAKMQESSFDLIITDMIMPEMNGIEMLLEMKEMNIDTKVIAMSAGGEEMDRENALQLVKILTAWNTINKPFKRVEIISLIKEVLS